MRNDSESGEVSPPIRRAKRASTKPPSKRPSRTTRESRAARSGKTFDDGTIIDPRWGKLL